MSTNIYSAKKEVEEYLKATFEEPKEDRDIHIGYSQPTIMQFDDAHAMERDDHGCHFRCT